MSVDIVDLSVAYNGGPRVVDSVEMRVATGEWLAVIGPNGAGKSTLLKAIASLISHDGDVHLDGTSSRHLARRDIALLVAYVPQEPLLPAGMTVTEYVLLGRTPHLPYLGSEGHEDLAAAREALEAMDLDGFRDRPLDGLSGGERQRVVLARAIAQAPSILLLDEPTSALDIGHRQQALERIGAMRRHRPLTIVSAMHDLTLAGQFADRLVMLAEGRVVADGSAAEVLTVERIAEHYGASVHVVRLPDGQLAVVPVRPAYAAPPVP